MAKEWYQHLHELTQTQSSGSVWGQGASILGVVVVSESAATDAGHGVAKGPLHVLEFGVKDADPLRVMLPNFF